MTKDEKIIYDLLLKEAGEEQLVEETNANNSTTEVCEEQNYNFKAGYEMPRDFQCAGVDNAGKYMRVGTDGYIRPMAGGGGGEGYEPDFATIELNDDGELAVVDYISASSTDELIDGVKVWVEDNFCLESFAVELDERVEELEEELTVLTPKVERALLTPLTTPTAPELVGIDTTNTQTRVKIGSGLTYNTSTDTLSATGGGSAEPVYVITGTATITDPSHITDIPIVISSTNPYSDLMSFYNENGRLPRIITDVEVVVGGQTLSKIQLDLFANNVGTNKIELESNLVENTLSLNYVDFALTSSAQEGSLSSIQLQERLTTNSAIRVREVHFPNGGIIDDLYLQKIDSHIGIDDIIPGTNISVSKDYQENTITISATGGSGTGSYNDLTDKPKINNTELSGNKTPQQLGMVATGLVNQSIDGIKYFANGAVAGSDSSYTIFGKDTISRHPIASLSVAYNYTLPDKTGTIALTSDIPTLSKYYLHTVSFETTQDNMHWQIGVINKSPNQFADIQSFWTSIEKIVSIFGTPTNLGGTKEIYFNGAMAESGAIHVRGIDENFGVKVKDIALTDVDLSSFSQFGIEEL